MDKSSRPLPTHTHTPHTHTHPPTHTHTHTRPHTHTHTHSVTSHRNGGSQKLIPRDNGHGVSALGPSETNIVPMSETLSAGSTPTKFPPLPRANSRKIHVKEFKAYLTDMLDDSGYKFSEEYEVK